MRFKDKTRLDPKVIGARIREAREQLRLSQDELAVAVSKDQRAISEYENGHRKLAVTDLPAFARVLNVPLLYFFEGNIAIEDLDRELLGQFHRLTTHEAKRAAIQIVRILSDTI